MKAMNRALWTAQGLLAALFMLGGVMKLMMPLDEIGAMMGVPGWFLVFISTCEILGSLGMILPGVLKIRTGLTPLAATGLVIIMVGGTVLTAMGVGGAEPATAVIPAIVGVLAAFVAYGRWQIVPFGRSSRALTLEPAA
jgi:hypothetical protein